MGASSCCVPAVLQGCPVLGWAQGWDTGLCLWGSQWRWDMGLSLIVSHIVPGKAQRPGSISQGDVDKQEASSPTPA